jgi:hypothetical protein
VPRRDLVFSLAVGVFATLLAWFRLDGRTRGVVWAEDGVFLQDRLDSGPLVSLVDPYQGYLHLLPRAVVEVAALAPVRDYAVAVTGLCCLAVGTVAALVHACSGDIVRTRAARVALGLVTVLVPTAAAELLGNTANLHWFLLWLTPWVLLHRPTTRARGWALGAVTLVVGLSEIQAAMFAPLLLVRRRDRHRWPVVGGLVAGIAAQLVTLAVAGRQASAADEGTPSLLDLVQGYGLHVFLQMWRPATAGVGDVLVDHGWTLIVAASVPFLLVLAALVATTRTRDDLVLALALLAGAAVPFVAGIVLNFRSFLAFDDFAFETLAIFSPLRYAVVPAMFVLAAAVVVADRAPRALCALGLAALLGLGLWHLDAGPTNRSHEPGWAASVERAAETCRRTGAETVEVRTTPETWEVVLSCADATGG